MKNNFKLQLLACAAAASLISGCATTSAYKQADKTGEGIAEFRDEVVNLKKAIDTSLDAVDAVARSANTDPRAAFETFAKSVDGVESASTKTGKRADDMKAQGDAYFKQWEQQLATLKSDEIRTLAGQRKEKLSGTFANIKTSMQKAKDAFAPFLSDLKDLRTYLGADLTVAGVDAAGGIITKTRASGAAVEKEFDDLIAELNNVAATLTATKAKPAK